MHSYVCVTSMYFMFIQIDVNNSFYQLTFSQITLPSNSKGMEINFASFLYAYIFTHTYVH